MIYVLFAIAAFMAIVTAFITNSITKNSKNSKVKKIIVIIISILAYGVIAVLLFQEKSYS
ncbi:MAG: hypothetical protein GZ091_09455 [Paludibacter sp.]|nr:hypothetical protein [Paludibacter sp.]